ncbi:hypothetical protein HCY62_08785 [Limosilactobacillus fermentum]
MRKPKREVRRCRGLLKQLIRISFTTIIGYVFAPIAWLMGVPNQDIVKVGSLMAKKLLTNEFAAMGMLQTMKAELTTKGYAIISTYLLGTTLGSVLTGTIVGFYF